MMMKTGRSGLQNTPKGKRTSLDATTGSVRRGRCEGDQLADDLPRVAQQLGAERKRVVRSRRRGACVAGRGEGLGDGCERVDGCCVVAPGVDDARGREDARDARWKWTTCTSVAATGTVVGGGKEQHR